MPLERRSNGQASAVEVEEPSRSGFFSRLRRKSTTPRNDSVSSQTSSNEGRVKSKKGAKLQKRTLANSRNNQQDVNELGERTYSMFSEASTLVGNGRRDHTDLIHGLSDGAFDDFDDGTRTLMQERDEEYLTEEQLEELRIRREKAERRVKNFPSKLWTLIASFLSPAEVASLALASKTLLQRLGHEPLRVLALPENKHYRIRFLNYLDHDLPAHLLCFPCATFHRRISVGNEKLKADYVASPLFVCPKVYNSYLPRMRLAHGRELPYSFIQLATRHSRHTSLHGINPDQLSRRWKDPESGWSHQSRYMINDGRLLMRMRSQTFAPPRLTPTGERHLLYDREDYVPYFSVCAHWQDGELMKICKCAMSHVPSPPESLLKKIRASPNPRAWIASPEFLARGCDECRPARRCPECPTEYLIEVTVTEDPKDPYMRFKHVLQVTRWSDLGDGSSPTSSPEYCAINGIKVDKGYDSFSSVGRRAVAGIFESRVSGTIPGQRMISLNPKGEKKGEGGHGWY